SSRDATPKNAASEASSSSPVTILTFVTLYQYINSASDILLNYPQYKKFFVNVPSYLTWIFWIFKPLLPAATMAKMTVVGTGSYTIGKSLLPHVNAKDLPKRYGGEAEAF
ncbi:hypothetical protein MPER_02018, partial [Moniliophthora perniciosa FA553]